MSFNGSGTFVINSSGQPVVTATTITASVHNALTADLATGLSTCITKDGQTTVTADIPFSTHKITGLGAGTARTDAASLATIQDGTGVYVGTVGGTSDVITLTPSPAITAYVAGQTFRFIASGANTTNVTVNVSGVGAKAVTKNGTTVLVANDILSGMMVCITYDGTRFILGTHLTADIVTLTASQTLTNKTLTAPVIASMVSGGQTVTVPASTDTLVGKATTDTLTNKTLTSPVLGGTVTGTYTIGGTPTVGAGLVTNGTAVDASAGSPTSVDFTSIPSWAKKITISFSGLSTNGTSDIIVQTGDSGGIENSGYLGCTSAISSVVASQNYTASFGLLNSVVSGTISHGQAILSLLDAANNLWSYSAWIGLSNGAATYITGGSKATSAALDRVRITTAGGVNTFDAGSINIQYQ